MTGKAKRLVLASASPRRKELLAHLLPEFDVIPSQVNESAIIDRHEGALPQVIVQELALAKARDVARTNTNAVVIGADTVVVIDGDILGKPLDQDEAEVMLSRLSGRMHDVWTGFAVVCGGSESADAERTQVTFKKLSDRDIDAYIATGIPMDKAGAYGIQDLESPVSCIEGDYFNVMGLPLSSLRKMLQAYYEDLPTPPKSRLPRP
jgi:septum formation protein